MTTSEAGLIMIDNAWVLWKNEQIGKISIFYNQNIKHYNIYSG